MANRMSIDALATRIITRYDRNGDGRIELRGDKSSYHTKDMPETIAASRRLSANKIYEHSVDFSNFFQAARRPDAENLGREDVIAKLKSYDQDSDGVLADAELEQAASDFTETRSKRSFFLLHPPLQIIDVATGVTVPGHDRRRYIDPGSDFEHNHYFFAANDPKIPNADPVIPQRNEYSWWDRLLGKGK